MSYQKSSTLRFLVVFLLAVFTLCAQGGLNGLESGVVFDPGARAIRPVLGVPGGAYLGSALVSGLEWGSVSPDGKLALGVAGGRLYLFRRADGAGMDGTLLEEDCGVPSKAAWSAGSDAAALYWAEGGRLRVWSGLPVGPRAADVGPVEGASALAVANAGSIVLFGAGGGVYAAGAGEPPRLIVPAVNPGAIVMDPGGASLYVADPAAKQIFEVTDFQGSANVTPLAGPGGGTDEPVGLAVSADGRRLFVADKAGHSLTVFDLESRAPVLRADLEFAPEQLERLSGSALFILKTGSAGGEPFQVLDPAPDPAVYFIPAAQVPVEVQ